MKRPKALALVSGGLDSTLAVALVKEQGVEIEALNFSTGFCFTDHHRAMKSPKHNLRNEALRAGADLGVPTTVIDISETYFDDVLLNPKHGYGANMNPCLDCRAYMLAHARRYLEETGADFVFTGEVLGQRPKSQFRQALITVARESGLEDRLLRPLSAKLLPPTLPEREGWIDREKLLGIAGRGRKIQIAEAARRGLDLDEIPQPAGGCCFLTDEAYARKLKDWLDHHEQPRHDAEAFVLLKVGRHLRLAEDVKVVVGRDEAENSFLSLHRRGRWVFWAKDFTGPTVLVEVARELRWEEIERIASITARYGHGREAERVTICWTVPDGADEAFPQVDARPVEEIDVLPAALDSIEPLRV
ncbi:MAG: 7-cyano-7-deazaguanine synthase [Gemmatimonadetes bacterium]|nr:7-cyano-7-deazaguanine synthase [Gemmatimonadota bacterium]